MSDLWYFFIKMNAKTFIVRKSNFYMEMPNVLEYFPSKTVVAIIGIVILTAIALIKGLNGALLLTAFAVIGGLAGYTLSEARKKCE